MARTRRAPRKTLRLRLCKPLVDGAIHLVIDYYSAERRRFGKEGRMSDSSRQITQLLDQWAGGDQAAFEQLLPLVYEDLHRQAGYMMPHESSGHTLQTTALVHEAYLKLVDQHSAHWQNRAHFFAVASQLMRRILIDHARRRHAGKRGGSSLKVELDEAVAIPGHADLDILRLNDALESLAQVAPREAQIVEMRFFGGLTIEEIAEVMHLAPITVRRDWNFARAWLYQELTKEPGKAAD
jgi:RNA polymerase sigma-70 factor (ECF subfamily)